MTTVFCVKRRRKSTSPTSNTDSENPDENSGEENSGQENSGQENSGQENSGENLAGNRIISGIRGGLSTISAALTINDIADWVSGLAA